MSIGIPTQTNPQNEPTPGSIRSLLDALTEVQAGVPTHPALAGYPEALNLKRWRPDVADTPMLYNWLLDGTNERKDTGRVRDVLNVSTRIGITYADIETRMPFVEAAADAYRAIVDAAFWNGMRMPTNPMGAASTWAMRTTFRSFGEEIAGTPVIGIEFIQAFWLDHAA